MNDHATRQDSGDEARDPTHRPVPEPLPEQPGGRDGVREGIEALRSMDPAEVADPAGRIADRLSRALDEEDR